MGVYIEGMEMPKSCHKCFIKQGSCPAIRKRIQALPKNNHIYAPYNYRHDDCPLRNVPTPNGRLIDADLLGKILKERAEDEWNKDAAPFSWSYAYECLMDTLDSMPTIIEREE